MKKINSLKRQQSREAILSLLPMLIILVIIRAYPIGTAVVKSFTNWDGMYKNDWVGVKNYISILTNRDFWVVLRNNLFLLLNVPLQVFLGLIVAVLLYEGVPGWRFYRSIYYFPQVVSPVIVGFLFRIFFSFEGPLNRVLTSIGLEEIAIEWLANGFTGMLVIIFCLVWINIGWQAILLLSGMSSINKSIFDAAKMDGVGYWRRTFKIVLPMILPVIEYSFIITVIWSFTAVFPFIYSLTNGGPGYQTTTLDYLIYLKVFVTGGRMAEACALSVILLFIMLSFSRLQMRISKDYESWSD